MRKWWFVVKFLMLRSLVRFQPLAYASFVLYGVFMLTLAFFAPQYVEKVARDLAFTICFAVWGTCAFINFYLLFVDADEATQAWQPQHFTPGAGWVDSVVISETERRQRCKRLIEEIVSQMKKKDILFLLFQQFRSLPAEF